MQLNVQLFGFPRIHLGGQPIDVPLRKALALIAFLAEARAPVARDAIAAMFWPEADEPAARARLRRTLYKLRGAAGAEIVAADRSAVRLSSALTVEVDTLTFERACDGADFEAASRLVQGEFLAGFSLDGCPEFQEWVFFRREALRSRLFQTFERLIETKAMAGRHHEVVEHATRLVALDPLSETAQRHLIKAHLLAGDRAAAERQLEACTRLLRQQLGVEPDSVTSGLLDQPVGEAGVPLPHTRYANSEGLHIAFQLVGSSPIDIVLVPGFVSHVERAWDEPRLRAFLTALCHVGRIILFDRRGIGLSDRVGDMPSTEATAQDIRAFMRAAGCRKALLIGASEAGPACIRFAVESPDRLLGLVLWGAFAKGSRTSDYPFALRPAQYNVWLDRLIGQWGGPAEIGTFAPSLHGDRQAEAWWAGLLRSASSPGAVKAVLEAMRDSDVRHLLGRITRPTLVLHRRGDRAVHIEAGRHLAKCIRGARLVELPGDDHWFWAGEQERPIEEIRNFARSL
jgi:DNA-binding SARP family transcriptional activator/pimeloyl-ACP methyl ester carboxylesterase